MLLVDTSAWIEHLRGTGSPAAVEMRRLVRDRLPELAVTEPVVMEILAGARDERAHQQLEELTNGLVQLPVNAHRDYHDAAALFRAARRQGKTVRKLLDCLIAAVALRNDALLLHVDADFEALAAVAPLRARRLGATESA